MFPAVLVTKQIKEFLTKSAQIVPQLKQDTLIYGIPSIHINGACCVKTRNKAKNIAFQAMSARQIPKLWLVSSKSHLGQNIPA